ncbi:MAG: hypothetical protein RR508_06400 [Oscillospiraceae bacterium]
MRDLLSQYAEDNRFAYNSDANIAYGFSNGFALKAENNNGNYLFTLFFKEPADKTLLQQLVQASTSLKIIIDYGQLTASADKTSINSALMLSAIAERLYMLAHNAGLESACAQCNDKTNLDMRFVDGKPILLCEECRAKARENDKKIELVQKKLIHKKDFLGAIIGAILGVIIYVFVYQLGATSVILGAVMGFVVSLGFQKAGGIYTAKGARLCSAICFVSLAAAEIMAIGLTLFLSYFWQGVTLWQAIGLIPKFIVQPGVMRAAIKDLAGAYILMLLVQLWSYLKAKKKFKKYQCNKNGVQ